MNGPYGQAAEAISPTVISSQMIVPISDTVMSRGHVIMLVGKGIGLDVATLLKMVTMDVDDTVECGEEETIVEVDGMYVKYTVECADKVEEEIIVEVDEIDVEYTEECVGNVEEETIIADKVEEKTIVEADETYMEYIEDMGVDEGTITKYDQC